MHSPRRALFFCLVALAALAVAARAQLVVTPINWTSAGGGTIGSVSVTVTGTESPGLDSLDLSGSDFSAGPLSSNEPVLSYTGESNWTVTLSQPTDLLLYVVYWRPEAGATYSFSQPFTILSGMSGATSVTSTSFILSGAFNSGILQFSNITSLALTIPATDSSYQALSLGVGTSAVPEPATYALWLGGVTVLAAAGLRHRRRWAGGLRQA